MLNARTSSWAAVRMRHDSREMEDVYLFILITWGRRIAGEVPWKNLLININYDSYCTMNSFSGWETRSR